MRYRPRSNRRRQHRSAALMRWQSHPASLRAAVDRHSNIPSSMIGRALERPELGNGLWITVDSRSQAAENAVHASRRVHRTRWFKAGHIRGKEHLSTGARRLERVWLLPKHERRLERVRVPPNMRGDSNHEPAIDSSAESLGSPRPCASLFEAERVGLLHA